MRPVLESDRLVLRPFGPADGEDLARIHSHAEVVCFFGGGAPWPAANTRHWLEQTLRFYRELDVGQLAVVGKALAPQEIYFVRDLPRTRNAKIVRRVIRARALGLDLGDLSSLENPQAVDQVPVLRGQE